MKERITYIRLAKYNKLRLTWFRKLRLVDPPNIGNVRVCRNRLVACHTDLVLIISVEINIFMPDMNETYQ